MAIRVVLAEDNYITREGIREVLSTAPEVGVVAESGSEGELMEAIARERPDVVVNDMA